MSAPAEDILCKCQRPDTSYLHCRQADTASPLQAVNKWVGIAGGEATNVLTRQLGALLVASAASLYNLKVSLLPRPSAAQDRLITNGWDEHHCIHSLQAAGALHDLTVRFCRWN